MKISACMIVKDEERMLPECLGSIRGFCDEIIICDTGSQDATKEVATSFGAKVYNIPWENSFSKARNRCLDYATGDWILIIDADERLVFERSAEDVRLFLQSQPEEIGAISNMVVDKRSSGPEPRWSAIRFFRKGRARYKYDIHNMLESVRENEKCAVCNDARIDHYGYVVLNEYNAKKIERTWNMLLSAYEETKDHRYLYYLAQSAAHRRDFAAAAGYAADYIQNTPRDSFDKTIWYIAVITNLLIGKKEIAEYWVEAGLCEHPDNPDLLWYAVSMSWEKKDTYRALKAANEWWHLYQCFKKNPNMFGSQTLYTMDERGLKAISYVLTLSAFYRGKEAWAVFCNNGWLDAAGRESARVHLDNLGLTSALMPEWGGLYCANL